MNEILPQKCYLQCITYTEYCHGINIQPSKKTMIFSKCEYQYDINLECLSERFLSHTIQTGITFDHHRHSDIKVWNRYRYITSCYTAYQKYNRRYKLQINATLLQKFYFQLTKKKKLNIENAAFEYRFQPSVKSV